MPNWTTHLPFPTPLLSKNKEGGIWTCFSADSTPLLETLNERTNKYMMCLPSARHTVLAGITIFTSLYTPQECFKYYDSDILLLMCRHSNPHVFSFFHRDLMILELCLEFGLVVRMGLCLELHRNMCPEVESGLQAPRSLR